MDSRLHGNDEMESNPYPPPQPSPARGEGVVIPPSPFAGEEVVSAPSPLAGEGVIIASSPLAGEGWGGGCLIPTSSEPLLLRALRSETTERTPVWFMRQAGRSDPKYRELRDRIPLPLEELFRDPVLSAEISLLPKRIGVDAIIFFQDILTPLAPMGAPFHFCPGPVLKSPIRAEADIAQLHLYDISTELPFVGETLTLLRHELLGEIPLLGFAGAPLTLFYFLVEGCSPGKGSHAEILLRGNPALSHQLLEKLTELTIQYLAYQIESGAQAVQLFESIADLLDGRLYRTFALPYQKEVFAHLGPMVPRILFAKGLTDLPAMKESGADVLSIHSHCSIEEARSIVGEDTPIQGNLNNRLLAEGSWEELEKALEVCLASGHQRGHVLNLDHGLLQHTPWERVEWVVERTKGGIQHKRGEILEKMYSHRTKPPKGMPEAQDLIREDRER